MSPEKELAIFERWPAWFNVRSDFRLSGMRDGFRCCDGWYDIIFHLCERLEPLIANLDDSGEQFQVLQVKEKFGGLRFYVIGAPMRSGKQFNWHVNSAGGHVSCAARTLAVLRSTGRFAPPLPTDYSIPCVHRAASWPTRI